MPGGVREAARQLETHMPTDTGCLWTEGEAKAAKALLENSAMVPVWSHLNQLIEFDDWFQLLVEVFIEPFGQPNKAANQNDEADGNASRYARMAEHAFGLLELLDDYRPAEGRPGHLPEVDALVDKSSLAEHLLKLIALTTACEWPKAEYADQYGLPSERPTQEDWRDCRSAETYAIWRHSTKKMAPIQASWNAMANNTNSIITFSGAILDSTKGGNHHRHTIMNRTVAVMYS